MRQQITIYQLLITLLLATPAFAQNFDIADAPMWRDARGRWHRRWGYRPVPEDQRLHNAITQALTDTPSRKKDAWAWRQSVEDSLTALGESALPFLRMELDQRAGYERDALLVAAFRIQNPGLRPEDCLLLWAPLHFPSVEPGAKSPIKIMRILTPAGFDQLTPHHLFYIIEDTRDHTRIVVALAADAKIQSVTDDPALTRFFQIELAPCRTPVARAQVADLTAILALSRKVTSYQAESFEEDVTPGIAEARLEFDTDRAIAKLTFTPTGHIASITTRLEKTSMTPAVPVAPPNPTAPPPPIPGGGI